MKTTFAIIALVLAVAGCNSGALNPAACANHPQNWCPAGTYCLVQGDQSKCAPTVDASSDQIDGSTDSPMLADVVTAADRDDAGDTEDAPTTVDVAVDHASEDAPDALPSTLALEAGTETRPADAMPDTAVGPSCGDGVKIPAEECDLGTALNTGSYGGCTAQCKLAPRCGDGTKNGPEECDQGTANKAGAYGKGLCTADCKNAPYCGDAAKNGSEVCDNGGAGATTLGACNPECSGYYEKKTIRPTGSFYSTNLGGPAGADSVCTSEFGGGWKALLVGGGRRATVTPFLGDGAQDWVIHKYTYYYNDAALLLWRTDDIPLLGVHAGTRQDVYADVFMNGGSYPWTGWADDWTTLPDNAAAFQGTCNGWTNATGWATFCSPNLRSSQSEACGGTSFILCAQQ